MKTEQRSIRKLKKSKFFKRKHNNQQIKNCCISLNTYGQYQPIVVSVNQILCGTLIYQSAKVLGWKKIQVYDLGQLSDQKKKQIRYLDNKTFQLSSWKQDELKQLLMMLQTEDICKYGFTEEQAYLYVNDLTEQQQIKFQQSKETLDVCDIYYCQECGWQGTKQELK